MDLVIFVVLTGAAGAYFTSVGCRHAQARHRRAGWRHACFGTFITALLAVLFVCQGDLFRPSQWEAGKYSIWFGVVAVSVPAGVVALVTSAIVVSVFRARFRNEKRVPNAPEPTATAPSAFAALRRDK